MIDALDGSRDAAVALFQLARAGQLDVAFSTRLEHELKTYSMTDVTKLLGSAPLILGTTARWDLSTWDGGDVYVADGSVSTAGPAGSGPYGMIDIDHLEAHRIWRREVFVTSDGNLLKAARARGFDAATPEVLVTRLSTATAITVEHVFEPSPDAEALADDVARILLCKDADHADGENPRPPA